MAELTLARLESDALVDYVTGQRWYGSKSREIAQARIVDEVPLRSAEPPLCSVVLAEVRFHPGTHDTYQLLLGARPVEERWEHGVVAEVDGWTVYDALADPALTRAVADMMRSDTAIEGGEGAIELRAVAGTDILDRQLAEPRAVSAEQSNSSVVFADELILKIYRRLEAGINPELELLRFLTIRGFPNIAPLFGWYAYAGRPLDATLGVLQRFVVGGLDGWEFALDSIAGEPGAFLGTVRRLGVVTGAMHSALASDPSDAGFAAEEPSVESLGLLVASVDEEIESVFLDLPEDDDDLAPIIGRGEEVREQLRMLSHAGSVGRVIRHHGDYHLGQVLWTGSDWIVIDFEGEPARSLSERRQKRSPLRDVAGMLRSFAYAAQAAPLLRDSEPPAEFEQRAREEFLAGYLSEVDASLLPPGEEAMARLLTVFELEKAVYELRYELDNRPDWVSIPVRGIDRLLHAGVA
jgi:trehalose synthase-fused probable maltokinase